MKHVDLVIIGAGPAGLKAALAAAGAGASVLILERQEVAGGQLVKQTHKFFGSEKQYASVRGIDIASLLLNKLKEFGERVCLWTNCCALGLYEDGIITAEQKWEGKSLYHKIKAERCIVATGASEKFLTFPNNDLPGIYGAGAVQTLMNVYGIRPGKRVLMVGAGNIGLIVSYQLLQAGVEIAAVIDAAPVVGGYHVHAAKLKRAGVPLLLSHSILYAEGEKAVQGAVITALDKNWQPIPGTESHVDCDVICISVGLSPLTEILWQAGCKMIYIPELGGHVPVRSADMETSIKGLYIAGDVCGIEEASSAMVEGQLAGLCAAASLGFKLDTFTEEKNDCLAQLRSLRAGPTGEKIRAGLGLAGAYQ